MFRNTTVITQQITMDPSSRFTNVSEWEEGKRRGKEGGGEERG